MLKRWICLLPLVLCGTIFGRGIGTVTFVVTDDGKLRASLGETYRDIVDADAGLIFRYVDEKFVAYPLDKPAEKLWEIAAAPQDNYWKRVAFPMGDLLIIVEERHVVAVKKTTGEKLYRTQTDEFTRLMGNRIPTDNIPAGSLLLFDDMPQHERSAPGVRDSDSDVPTRPARHAATLGRFDLKTGKWAWKMQVVQPGGRNVLIKTIDGRGVVNAGTTDAVFFDPETGKVLAEKPAGLKESTTTQAPAGPRYHVVAEGGKPAVLRDTRQKRDLWPLPAGAAAPAVLLTDSLALVPLSPSPQDVEGKTNKPQFGEVVAHDLLTGKERWRFALPAGKPADMMNVGVRPCKMGFLIEFHWLVLD